MTSNYSLNNLLGRYGFSNLEQKNAIEYLLQKSNILGANQTIDEEFTPKANYHDLVMDVVTFVNKTQDHFTIRKGTQERWHVQPKEWIIQLDYEKGLNSLRKLEIISQINPQNEFADAVCILGATMPTMFTRIKYVEELYANGLNIKNIILLTGERYVTKDIDASEEVLMQIATNYALESISSLTETHLFDYLFKNSSLFNKFPTYIIDTPAKNTRPTTHTTMVELAGWLKEHEDIKNITFVSNQPYVKYQEAIINETLRTIEIDLNYEVVGSEYEELGLQSAIGSLGSYIYAKTPDVLIESEEKISDPIIIGILADLYSKQPLVYHNLEYIFLKNCTLPVLEEI